MPGPASAGGSFADAGALDTTWTAPDATDAAQTIMLTLMATDDGAGARSASVTVTVTVEAQAAPAVSDVDVTSEPGDDDTYAIGDTIQVTVTFDQAVTVTGAPRIQLRVGGGEDEHLKWADYLTGTGAAVVQFTYVVLAGDFDDNGIYIAADELELNGGTIQSSGGTDANLDYPLQGTQSGHNVDGVLPTPEFAATSDDGSSVIIIFSESLSATTAAASAFTVSVDTGTAPAVSTATASGDAVTLGLASAVTSSQAVTVAYVDATSGDDPVAVQDAAGNDAANFTTGEGGVPAVSNAIGTGCSLVDGCYVVSADWGLIPSGLGAGAEFRLIFISSTTRNASSSDITDYNTLVQTAAAAGHADIQVYGSTFRVVGSTADVDARDNTATRYTGDDTAGTDDDSDLGVPIYWLGASKVADEYKDFYDGDWDDEANAKDESGSDRSISLDTDWPLTGSDHDGTESFTGMSSRALGASSSVRVGRPNSSTSGNGPLRSNNAYNSSTARPLYGLSPVFRVEGQVVTNTAPAFTTGADFSTDENETIVGTVEATDDDAGDAVRYAITGGADSAQFQIDETTGVLRFTTAPDYEMPADVESTDPADDAGNNVYLVTVTATSGAGDRELTVMQTITVTVNDVVAGLGAPTELNAAADGRTAIDLSWTAPVVEGAAITGYRIEVSTDDDPTWTDAVTNTNSTDTRYRYTDVLPGATYHFRVSAIDSGGPGTASDVASVSIDPGPRSFLFHIEEARLPTIDRTGRQFEMWFIFQNLGKPVFLSENILDAIQVEHGMASDVRCLVEAFVSCASSPNSGHNYYVFTVTADESQYSGSEGTLTVSLRANVIEGGNQAAQREFSVDLRDLTVTLAGPPQQPVTGDFNVGIEFNLSVQTQSGNLEGDPLWHFRIDDVTVDRGEVRSISGADTTWSTEIRPPDSYEGDLTVQILADAVRAEEYTNGNEASEVLSVRVDTLPPKVTITAPETVVQKSTFTATFTFSEPVTGFTEADIGVAGGTLVAGSLTGTEADPVWTVRVTAAETPDNDRVGISLPPDTVTDEPGNLNSALAELFVTVVYEPSLVPTTWSLIPSDLGPGDSFRLLFIGTTSRNASDSDIDVYNTFVQNLVATNGHADIKAFSATFRMLGSTEAVDARDNTGTTGTGVAIYWLGGAQVADDYADFYDGDWDEEATGRRETGDSVTIGTSWKIWTGSAQDGTEAMSDDATPTSRALGNSNNAWVMQGSPNGSVSDHGPIESDTNNRTNTRGVYGLSGVFTVSDQAIANNPPAFSSAASFSVEENQTDAGTVMAADPDAVDTVTYAITGGADQAKFDIDASSGLLTIPTSPDYENPTDAGGNNTYMVTVTATGGTGARALTTDQAITVTVTDVDEPPSAPATPTVSAVSGSSDSLSVTWTAPDNSGKPDIDSYDLQYRKGTTGNFTNGPQDVTVTTTIIGALDADSLYQVQVRATNDEGDGEWSPPGSGTPGVGMPLAITLSLDVDSDIFVSIFNDEILVSEGVGSVRIGLRAQTEGNVKPTEDFQITLDAVDGTASAGEDYRWPSPRFVFQAADFVLDNGHYVLTVSNTLEIINEEIVEKNENLELTILDPTTLPSYVTVPDRLFTGHGVEIRNDDEATVSMMDIVMNEGEEFEGRLVVDQLVEFLFTVIVSIQGNEKYSSHDEFEKSSSIVGLGRQSRTTFTVTSIDNSRFEPDQTFEVRLIGSGVPDSIKFDNDPPPTITVVDDEVPTRPTGPLIEVDDNGDGVVDADPVVTLPLGGTATFWVRPGACTGGKQVWLEGFSAYEQRDVPQHIALEASPNGHTWTCADDGKPGEWRLITLSGPGDSDLMLVAPFDATVRHTVAAQRPGYSSWDVLLFRGHLLKVRMTAPETLAPVGSLTVAPEARDYPRVTWSAVPGATDYQVQWRWGPDEKYGRVHSQEGSTYSREKRTEETAYTIPISETVPTTDEGVERSQRITVRVRPYDSEGLAVGPWREASLAERTEVRRVLAGFSLLDADGSSQGLLAALTDGATVELADPDGGSYAIRAELVEGELAGSVHLELTGKKRAEATDDEAPYLLAGGEGMALPAGSYTLKAKAYGGPNRTYAVQDTLEVSFTVRAAASAEPGSGELNVEEEEEEDTEPLTARFEGLPEAGHGGAGTPFAFRLVFSEAVSTTPEALRDHALEVTNAAVEAVSRVDDRSDLWEVRLTPESDAMVTVSLSPPPTATRRGRCAPRTAGCCPSASQESYLDRPPTVRPRASPPSAARPRWARH